MKYRIVKDNNGFRLQRKKLGFWFYFWDYVPNDFEMSMERKHRRFKSKDDIYVFLEKLNNVDTVTFEYFELNK